MVLLMLRTIGVIAMTIAVLVMYISHVKRKAKFIKRKPVTEKEKISYQKWEKIIHVIAILFLVFTLIFVTIPCCMDLPYLFSNNLIEVSGVVTHAAKAGAKSGNERRIHIVDSETNEEHTVRYYGSGSVIGDVLTVRYLPHTQYGYIVAASVDRSR